MIKLTLDWETRSRVDLKKAGVYPYGQHSSTDILCAAVIVEVDGKAKRPQAWVNLRGFAWAKNASMLRARLPLIDEAELLRLLAEADEIEAHNAQFERVIHTYVGARYGWPAIPLEKWRCSAAKCAMHALPRGLGDAAEVLRSTEKKDFSGYQVMLKFCKPRKATKAQPEHWYEDTEDFIKLVQYCIQDTITEHGLSKKLHDLPESELDVWRMDQGANDRGVPLDTNTAAVMINVAQSHADKLKAEFREVVNYALESPTQGEKFLLWLEQNGAVFDDLKKQNLLAAMKADDSFDDLDVEKFSPRVRRALELRSSLSKASVKKYDAMIKCACDDGRARGMLLYHGASTGRWTGKLVQLQNFPRGSMEPEEVLLALAAAHVGGAPLVDWMFGDPMSVASSCLRAMITAGPDKDLMVADYSAIEGRVLAWLAGEQWVLDAYIKDLRLYAVAAAGIYKVPYEEIMAGRKAGEKRYKQMDSVGKVSDLASGYQGWVSAFQAMAANYGVTISDEEAEQAIKAWRQDRPQIVGLWKGLETCALRAVKEPGAIFEFRGVAFRSRGNFLRMRLPSGRILFYPWPGIEATKDKYGREKDTVTYEGYNTKPGTPNFGEWTTLYGYGGKWAENAVQALARDIMVNGMRETAKAGYDLLFTVHDEIISEVDAGKGGVEEFCNLLCTLPTWAAGLPLKAAGFRTFRYKKD